MNWISNFYSKTGKWWGPVESEITERDHERVTLLKKICPNAKKVLELGSGYGNTASATASEGYEVVANELSERIKFAKQFEQDNLEFIKGDFYTTDLGGDYDVVAYWNGFGVGTDTEQRILLKRIANEWLNTNGKALVDIGNPFVRASWNGEEEHKDANPELGYQYTIDEITAYDPVNNRFIDTWWESDKPNERLTQSLRNYTPADLILLLEGTGLRLESLYVAGNKLETDSDYVGFRDLLIEEQEYLAVLVKN